jgi:hypothetical protein
MASVCPLGGDSLKKRKRLEPRTLPDVESDTNSDTGADDLMEGAEKEVRLKYPIKADRIIKNYLTL